MKDLAEQVNLKAGAAKGPVSLALVSLRGYARIPPSSGCSESAFSFRAGGPSRSHASLNQYQAGMCISGVLKTTERTARHLISPLGPKGMPTDSAV